MEDSLHKDVKYLGPKSQNELIDIISKKLIQRRIIEEIIEAGVHSIPADKVTTCNDEILYICLRYVNNDNKICAVFMEFVELERITGEAIGNAISKFYNDIGLEIAQCRGQSPKAIVTHCCSHNLNLSLASSCKHPEIDNILKIYKAMPSLNFFNSSPKREGLLEYIVRSSCIGAEKRKVLIGMSKTRWFERDISYEHFYLAIPFMVAAFEIMNGTYPKNNDFNSVYKDGWDSKTKEDAASYLNAITKF